MKITKDYPGLKETEFGFEFDGSIESEAEIEIELTKTIFVSKRIKAKTYINAGDGISAGWGISAGLHIKCRKILRFTMNLFAGIVVYKKPTADEQTVECAAIEGGGEIKSGILKLLTDKRTTRNEIEN